MRVKLLIIAFLALGVSGCNEKGDKVVISERLVTRYQNPVTMYAEVKESTEKALPGNPSDQAPFDQFVVNIRTYENTVASISRDLVGESTVEMIAAQFNDTHYNRSTDLTLGNPMMYVQTESLDIISDADYDGTHPAGSSLNDLFTVKYVCADDILKNNYSFELTEKQTALHFAAWEFLDPITDFNLRKPTVVQFYFWLYPNAKPDVSGTHRFTVTYKNVAGKTLSATTTPIAIAGK